MNNFDIWLDYFSSIRLDDWRSIVVLIVGAIVLYFAFRIGTFILKIVIGLAAIALVVVGIMQLLPLLGL